MAIRNPNLDEEIIGYDTLQTDEINDLEVRIGNEIGNITTQLAEKITKNRGAVTSADLSQEVKEQMTGGSVAVVGKNTVLNENIVDGQVSPNKVSFLSKGINKFNGDYSKLALLSSGVLSDTPGAMTIIIPINGGQTYYIRKDASNRQRLGWHRGTPKVGEVLDYFVGDNWDGSIVVEAPIDAQYMVFMVSFDEGSPNIRTQVTEGEDYPFFFGYDFLDQSNVIGLTQQFKTVLLYPTGSNDFVVDINSNQGFIKVISGTRAYWNNARLDISNEDTIIEFDSLDTIQVAWFNIESRSVNISDFYVVPKRVPVLFAYNPVSQKVSGINSDLISINGVSSVDKAIINKVGDIDFENKSKYFFLEDLDGIYDKPSDIQDGSSGTELDLINSNHSVIYDIYDDLLTTYPNYVSKRVIGQDSNGLDINEYSFTAPRIGNENNYHINVPKIIAVSGVHGYEQGSTYSTAMFFKDLAEKWQTKEQLEFLRWNVDFVIIPVANPDGYDNNRRINHNGVDPNRNFWEGTRTTGSPGNDYFGGFEGMAEPEVKAIAKMIDENLDADFYIDYHNIASGYPMAYTYNDTDRTLMNSLYRTLSKKWAKDYPEAPQDGTMMGYIKGPIADASVTYASKQGIKSTLLETPWKMPFANNKYDKTTLEIGTEALGNLIVAIVKSLK